MAADPGAKVDVLMRSLYVPGMRTSNLAGQMQEAEMRGVRAARRIASPTTRPAVSAKVNSLGATLNVVGSIARALGGKSASAARVAASK